MLKKTREATPPLHAQGTAKRNGENTATRPKEAVRTPVFDVGRLSMPEVGAILALQRAIGNREVRGILQARWAADQARPGLGSHATTALGRRADEKNDTGLPDNLKAGVETLSGLSLSDVRVHYNSSKPAQVRALAYTQGTDIYVGPRQEGHLPHEASLQAGGWPNASTGQTSREGKSFKTPRSGGRLPRISGYFR